MSLVTKDCAQCGKPFVSHSCHARKYCSRACYWSMATQRCAFCGGVFQVHRAQIRKGGGKYCSRACYEESLNGRRMAVEALEAKARSLARHFRQRPPSPTVRAVLAVLDGLHIAYQVEVPIGRWVADILCPKQRVVVEVDGRWHNERRQRNHDRRRDEDLQRRGLAVVRIADCHNFHHACHRRRWEEQERKLECAFAGLT